MYDMYTIAIKKTFSNGQLGILSYFLLGEDVYQEENCWPHTAVHIKIFLVFHWTNRIISAKVTAGSLTFSRDLPQGGWHVLAVLTFCRADERLLCKSQELVTKNLSGLLLYYLSGRKWVQRRRIWSNTWLAKRTTSRPDNLHNNNFNFWHKWTRDCYNNWMRLSNSYLLLY